MRPLSHVDHRKFVETEGWEVKGTARSPKMTGDHHRFTLTLANGEVLYTRVSHDSGQIDDSGLVRSILRDQLRVTEVDFYRCVKKGVLPTRPLPPEQDRPAEGIDAKLMRNLLRKVGLAPAQIAAMTKAEAARAWEDHLTCSKTGTGPSASVLLGHARTPMPPPTTVIGQIGEALPSRGG